MPNMAGFSKVSIVASGAQGPAAAAQERRHRHNEEDFSVGMEDEYVVAGKPPPLPEFSPESAMAMAAPVAPAPPGENPILENPPMMVRRSAGGVCRATPLFPSLLLRYPGID